MESSLDQALDNALIAPEIDGVCVIDSNGFCIASKGTLSGEGSAVYKQILMAATRMERTSGHPTITLTTESGEKIFIQEQNGVVVALNIKDMAVFSEDEEEPVQSVDYSHMLQTTPSTSRNESENELFDDTYTFLLKERQRNRDDILSNMASPAKSLDPFSLAVGSQDSSPSSPQKTKSSLKDWLMNVKSPLTPVPLCKTPKSRTPLSVLTHREQRLLELRNEDDSDPEFEPLSYRQLRNQIKKKLEGKECLEDRLPVISSRELRRRQEAFVIDEDDDDNLPLFALKEKLKSSKITEGNNAISSDNSARSSNDCVIIDETGSLVSSKEQRHDRQTTENKENVKDSKSSEESEEKSIFLSDKRTKPCNRDRKGNVEVQEDAKTSSSSGSSVVTIDELPATEDEDDLPLSEIARFCFRRAEKEETLSKTASIESVVNGQSSGIKARGRNRNSKEIKEKSPTPIDLINIADEDELQLSTIKSLLKRQDMKKNNNAESLTDTDLFESQENVGEGSNISLCSTSSTDIRKPTTHLSLVRSCLSSNENFQKETVETTPTRKKFVTNSSVDETPRTIRPRLRKRPRIISSDSSDVIEDPLPPRRKQIISSDSSPTTRESTSTTWKNNAGKTPNKTTTPKTRSNDSSEESEQGLMPPRKRQCRKLILSSDSSATTRSSISATRSNKILKTPNKTTTPKSRDSSAKRKNQQKKVVDFFDSTVEISEDD